MKKLSLYFGLLCCCSLLLTFSSCSEDNSTLNENATENVKALSRAEIIAMKKNIPAKVEVGGYQLTLNVGLWRDFQPVLTAEQEKNGSPLSCVCNLLDANGRTVPSSFTFNDIYVFNGDDVWSANCKNETFTSVKAYQSQGVAYGGPTWNTGISVDVVCEFTYNGKVYQIVSNNNQILRAE
jgi:hypothetical protein